MKTEHTTGMAKNTGLSEENMEAIGDAILAAVPILLNTLFLSIFPNVVGKNFFLFILIKGGISYVEVQLLLHLTSKFCKCDLNTSYVKVQRRNLRKRRHNY